MSPSRSDRRIGIAIDGTTAAIVWRDASIRESRAHSATAPCDGTPSSIDEAVRSLAGAIPVAAATTAVLDRPLAHTRTIHLPQMSRAALIAILERDWTRYLIAHRQTPHTVKARALGKSSWLAAFAPADTLETLATAAEAHGWRTLVTCTSDDALAGAARALAPKEAGSGDCFVVLCAVSGPTHALQMQQGLPLLGRRLLADASHADVDAFIETTRAGKAATSNVLLLGHSAHTTVLARSLEAGGTRARSIDLGLDASATGIELLAAAAATTDTASLPLESSRDKETGQRHTRMLTTWLYLGAAAVLLAGFALARLQTRRALTDLQAQRADMAGPVRSAMMTRASLERSITLTGHIAERESNTSATSTVLASIAQALPDNATLTSLTVIGDSVMVEGESARSATVYQALRGIPALEQIKLASPLRQERQAGDVAVEHFSFSARVRRGGKAK